MDRIKSIVHSTLNHWRLRFIRALVVAVAVGVGGCG